MTWIALLGAALDGVLIGIQFIFVVCCWVYLVSGLDDLAVDGMFAWYVLRDRIAGRHRPWPSVQALRAKPEQHFAVMFPAWHEAEVIGAAVANYCATIEYARFHIFIGTYPNDPDTQREADKLVARFANVHKVVTGAPGPTCKADCLNHIIEAIRALERREGIGFAGVVMQDAEDVVHPLLLRVFNHHVPDCDLVQTPVLSLPRRWWEVTAGHYMEEFAEFHAKEMLVRERFAGVVPGSGVGTCYSRRALSVAEATGETFSTRSLTEDYEFSFRLREAELRMAFVRMPLHRRVPRTGWSRLLGAERQQREWIGTREFFPGSFRAAFRQKARWTVGISLQGWANFGWRGNWRIRYLFWRDRRGLVLSHVTLLGAVTFLAFLGLEGFALLVPEAGRPAPLMPDDSWLWNLVWINIGLLAHRLAQRHYWSWVHFGPGALPLVSVRYLWAAIINYCALVRATRLWARYLATGARIGWDKTRHQYPISHDVRPAGHSTAGSGAHAPGILAGGVGGSLRPVPHHRSQ